MATTTSKPHTARTKRKSPHRKTKAKAKSVHPHPAKRTR